MPSEIALVKIYAALKAILVADAGLIAGLAAKPIGSGPGIYDEGSVPQAASMPYLTIGAGTQVPAHTMGEQGLPRYGWNCTVQIKAVAQGAEAVGMGLMNHVMAALYDGRPLTLTGYSSAWCDETNVVPTIVDVQAGVVIRHWPIILRVWCHD